MTKDKLSSSIAANIRRHREAQKLTLSALSDRSDVSEDYLGHIEHGRKMPAIPVLAKIASGLGVGLEDLVRQRAEPESAGSTTQRLQRFLRGLNEGQKADILAILTKLKRAERLRALRLTLGA